MPQYTGFKIGLDKKNEFLCIYLKSVDGWSILLETESSAEARLMGMGQGLGGSILAEKDEDGETLRFQNFEICKEK